MGKKPYLKCLIVVIYQRATTWNRWVLEACRTDSKNLVFYCYRSKWDLTKMG